MNITNFEFKARCNDIAAAEKKLLTLNPEFRGEDQQTDTYFNVSSGRLKLREGNIENALIYYHRENIAGAKLSDILLYPHSPDKTLKDILTTVHGIKVIVKKRRRIYFIGNVKFHFDMVAGLGEFIEVEAIDNTGNFSTEELKEQCDRYIAFFGIAPWDFMKGSYSDMLCPEL